MAEAIEQSTKALVLGGGGTTGVAWELGVLLGLHDRGVDVTRVGLIVGTSAGSVVGAQMSSGLSLEELFARQLVPLEETKEQVVQFDLTALASVFTAGAGAGGAQAATGAIGGGAPAGDTTPEQKSPAGIAEPLSCQEKARQQKN